MPVRTTANTRRTTPSVSPRNHLQEFQELGYTLYLPREPQYLELIAQAAKQAGRFIEPHHKKDRGFTHEDGIFDHILYPHHLAPCFRELIESAPIRAALHGLFGPIPLYVTHSKISYKFVNRDQSWLPHQDSGYKIWPCHGATLSIFLESSSVADGTLQVFPGSHLLGRLKHKRVLRPGDNNPQATVVALPEIQPISVEGKAGDILVFSIDMIHQSGPNLGRGNRSILIFEVEKVRLVTLESDGSLAMVLNGTRNLFQAAASRLTQPFQITYSRAKTLARKTLKRLFPRQK